MFKRGRTSEPTSDWNKKVHPKRIPIHRHSQLITSSGDHRSGEGNAAFRLADTVYLYAQPLEQLGIDAPAVKFTRLKKN